MSTCPCGSEQAFEACCKPALSGESLPETAEKLMRSRYTAYTCADIGYLDRTLAPESREGFDPAEAKRWAESSKWKGLRIVDTQLGGPLDTKGLVEFEATYEQDGAGIVHHEVSRFRKTKDGRWLFVDGEFHTHKEGEHHHHGSAKPATVVRESPKIGRNDPCHCGSGKKYKKCCATAA